MTALNRSLLLAVAPAAFIAGASDVRAAVILHEVIVPILVPETIPLPPIREKTATGHVSIIDPAGNETRKDMPPGGGRIEVFGGVNTAIAGARVDLGTQRKSSGWIVDAASGWTASAKADIDVKWIEQGAIDVLRVYLVIFEFLEFLPEITDAYIGPNLMGSLGHSLSLVEMSTNTVLFESLSTLSSSSPDTVVSSDGAITWNRAPGPFGGLNEITDTLLPATAHSENRWIMDLTPQSISYEFSLAPNQPLSDLTFALIQTTSGSFTSNGLPPVPNGGYAGFSATIPLPASILMLGLALGLSALFGRAARREQA